MTVIRWVIIETYVGMSGGGVYSKDGELIGIHGAGEALQSGDSNKTGSNFAVQINDAIVHYRSQMSRIFLQLQIFLG